jgi:hypothetical protein
MSDVQVPDIILHRGLFTTLAGSSPTASGGHDTEVRFTHARRERNKVDWPLSRPPINCRVSRPSLDRLAASRDPLINSDIFPACVKRTPVS